MKPEQDTPRIAFDLLSGRDNTLVIAALVALSIVAWTSTIDQAHAMRGMVMGLGQIGYRNQGEMGAVGFLGMWSTMMAAMMLPTIVPMVLAHHAVARRRYDGVLSTPAFVAGYFLVWCAVGIVVLLVYWIFARWGDDAAQSRWLVVLAGEMLVGVGAYQFTRWKRFCADMCRSPLEFVFMHDFRRGVRNAFRAGMVHGVYCVGCCWALLGVLVVVGLSNTSSG